MDLSYVVVDATLQNERTGRDCGRDSVSIGQTATPFGEIGRKTVI